MQLYWQTHIIIRGDVIVRGGFVRNAAAGMFMAGQGGFSTGEFYPGLIVRDNWCAGYTAGGLVVQSGTHVVAEGILVEDNTLLIEETAYGVKFGGGGVEVNIDSSLSLRNSIVRRNSARHAGGLSLSIRHTHSLSHALVHTYSSAYEQTHSQTSACAPTHVQTHTHNTHTHTHTHRHLSRGRGSWHAGSDCDGRR